MLAYFYTHELKVHTELWNIKDFRVPIVTTSEKRMQYMIEVNKMFNNGEGSELFVFATREELRNVPDMTRQTWIDGRG